MRDAKTKDQIELEIFKILEERLEVYKNKPNDLLDWEEVKNNW